ncbi:MAG TPA: proline dehydrogenase family protein [Chthonomonadaceae bacterium]|nr:proline dehydrogenase family protein [Chthonomonadaceae bacterium]
MLTRAVLLQLANNKKMESFVRRNPISAPLVRRFIAGETLEAATEPVRALNARGISVSLDFLGESVTNSEEVAASVDTYLRVFQHIRCENLDANVSLKLTALGLDLDPDLCYRNMLRLLHAAGPDLFVRIDMESSDYTQRTLDMFTRLWEGPEPHKNVGVVIQSYLYRSAEDVEKLIQMGARVRLVKGAYKEPASVAYPNKADVDRNYIVLMQRLLLKGNYPAIATHDAKIIEATKQFARENQIASDRFEFQMLYGIRRDLQFQLAKEGYRMRVYTPFGSHWYPYLMRRLAERPANLWFVAKNLFRS